jgi:uncharacterized protein YdcH (DUF465 family)
MPTAPQEVRELLLASNPEFQRLAQEHSRYETQLDQLSKEPYLSVEILNQLSTLKKLKLRVKDQMERLIAEHLRKQSQG